MYRRTFLKNILSTSLFLPAAHLWSHSSFHRDDVTWSESSADIVIIGGSLGGCAAAFSAARNGHQVILTEQTRWIGGQITSQAVPPDEHPWIEQFGCTRSYRQLRNGIRDYYRRWYPLAGPAMRDPRLNPGNGAVSRLCHEPRVALNVLQGMLAPYVSGGQVTLLTGHEPVSAAVDGDRVESVRVRNLRTGTDHYLTGRYFLDATEFGDLLPLTGTEYVTGAESQTQTGEPHAPAEPQPENMQAVTWCFALEYREGEDHTIHKPGNYDFWRNYRPDLQPPWSGHLLSWTYSHPITLKPRTVSFDPRPGAETEHFNLWEYRRISDPTNFQPGTYPGGITLVNWPQNDYFLGNFIEVSADRRRKHMQQARELSYSLLYWLQTEAPHADGGTGWPGLRLRGDLTGTEHGLAMYPYVRESRRIKAEFTVLEQHVGTEARMETTGLAREEVTAQAFPDSVGVGSYRIDLHPSTGGDNYIDISSLPFQIPLGALLPVRMENLLPACKNIGTTHITNGCYRLHPVEWNIGESAGLLAGYCLNRNITPRQVRGNPTYLEAFQGFLREQGVELEWREVRSSVR